MPEIPSLFNRWRVTEAHSSSIQVLVSHELSGELLWDSHSIFFTLPACFPDTLNWLSKWNTAVSSRHWYLDSSSLHFWFTCDDNYASQDVMWHSLPPPHQAYILSHSWFGPAVQMSKLVSGSVAQTWALLFLSEGKKPHDSPGLTEVTCIRMISLKL